jgi:hypothetical protein
MTSSCQSALSNPPFGCCQNAPGSRQQALGPPSSIHPQFVSDSFPAFPCFRVLSAARRDDHRVWCSQIPSRFASHAPPPPSAPIMSVVSDDFQKSLEDVGRALRTASAEGDASAVQRILAEHPARVDEADQGGAVLGQFVAVGWRISQRP